MNNYSDIAIIIPTLNEAQNIEELIQNILRIFPQIKIIVADDGSKDKTQDIVNRIHGKNSNITLLDRSKEKIHGLTASVLDGIKIATTPFFIVMDADLQHPPEKIEAFINTLRSGQADFVIGIREKVIGDWPLHRRALSNLGRLMGRWFLLLQGKNCNDVLSGFFAGKTDLAKNLINQNPRRFEPKGYKILFDLIKVAPKNIKIAEVAYAFNERKRGSSKINVKHLLYYFRSFFS
ncbi:MAG: polyprenol monophosphomannose synthase [Candidatus Margulisbacteria bacterium]|nr:polyprenol monophosphomannose synthase [Candidatus Margulisiibacteriota bacterium]MBU1021918.1 polyprenol monophosphomannose synthase [Candidatus Margulisiibacteriota bacterium]MBU1728556.1 polyprenol monophosphomannose synthase [Candidatus Margulisiibacteriota bacterium]MBU1954703.1 polyprenol monophosphomannose synthase [Candidatus Margulisiibacteriota bacterium]